MYKGMIEYATTILAIIAIIVIIVIIMPNKRIDGFEELADQPLDETWAYVMPFPSPVHTPYFAKADWSSYDDARPNLYDYNYRRKALFSPSRGNKLNYYYNRPYGLRKQALISDSF